MVAHFAEIKYTHARNPTSFFFFLFSVENMDAIMEASRCLMRTSAVPHKGRNETGGHAREDRAPQRRLRGRVQPRERPEQQAVLGHAEKDARLPKQRAQRVDRERGDGDARNDGGRPREADTAHEWWRIEDGGVGGGMGDDDR